MYEKDIRDKGGCRIGLIGARKYRKLTQQELADKAHVSRSLIAKLETGDSNASDDIWKMLKKILDVKSVEEIWEKYVYRAGYFIGDDGTEIRDDSYFDKLEDKEQKVG